MNHTIEWQAKPIAKGRAWSAVAVGWTHAVAVSREGALYGWGENDPDGDDPKKIGHLGLKGVERAGRPRQLGSRTDWMDVTASYGLTKEGQIWGWGRSSRRWGQSVNDEGFHTSRLLQRDGLVELVDSERGVTVKDKNGDWWFLASEWPESAEAPKRMLVRVPGDWRYVMGAEDRGLGIKTDGTLWNWRPGDTVSDATRIGRRSDWIAVDMANFSYCGLTADGTAWLWGRPLDGGHGGTRLIPYPWRPQPKGIVVSETTR